MESLAESLEFEAMLYQWIYIIFLIITVIVIVKTLIQRSEYESIANQYQNLLNKYNAKDLCFLTYETGIDGVPENSIICFFLDNDAIGFQLWNSEYNNIIRLDLDQINWIAGVWYDEYIDIDFELPPTEVPRTVISYMPKSSNESKYIILNSRLDDEWLKQINGYEKSLDGHDILTRIALKTSFCPEGIIHSRNKLDSNIIEL